LQAPIAAVLASALVFFACADSLFPRNATRFDPPALYTTLWRTVEFCSGISGNLYSVRWYSTPGAASPSDHDAVGSWWPDGNRIYLNEQFIEHFDIIRHEMLHALDRGKEHSPKFLVECGELGTCVAGCLTEAGPPTPGPTASSPTIAPAELDVSTTILAPEPGDSGYTTVIVRARNPYTYPVWVQLEGAQGIEFICLRGVQPCGSYSQLGPGALGEFGALQSRQYAYVFSVSPGTFTIVGGYDSNRPDTLTLVIPPVP
jgi:hypothetical protein